MPLEVMLIDLRLVSISCRRAVFSFAVGDELRGRGHELRCLGGAGGSDGSETDGGLFCDVSAQNLKPTILGDHS